MSKTKTDDNELIEFFPPAHEMVLAKDLDDLAKKLEKEAGDGNSN